VVTAANVKSEKRRDKGQYNEIRQFLHRHFSVLRRLAQTPTRGGLRSAEGTFSFDPRAVQSILACALQVGGVFCALGAATVYFLGRKIRETVSVGKRCQGNGVRYHFLAVRYRFLGARDCARTGRCQGNGVRGGNGVREETVSETVSGTISWLSGTVSWAPVIAQGVFPSEFATKKRYLTPFSTEFATKKRYLTPFSKNGT